MDHSLIWSGRYNCGIIANLVRHYVSCCRLYTPFHPDVEDTGGQTLLKSLLNSLIILCVVVVMTFLLIILYKLRCYKLLHGWIILSSLMLLFMFAFIYIQELLKTFNIAMDLFTIIFCLLNFGVTGKMLIIVESII